MVATATNRCLSRLLEPNSELRTVVHGEVTQMQLRHERATLTSLVIHHVISGRDKRIDSFLSLEG